MKLKRFENIFNNWNEEEIEKWLEHIKKELNEDIDLNNFDYEENNPLDEGRDAWYIDFFIEHTDYGDNQYSIYLTNVIKLRDKINISFYDNDNQFIEEFNWDKDHFIDFNGNFKKETIIDKDDFYLLIKIGLTTPTEQQINDTLNNLKDIVYRRFNINIIHNLKIGETSQF